MTEQKHILCYGDSNTYGFDPETGGRYPGNIRWTGALAGMLGNEYIIIAEGCNGRTTAFPDDDDEWLSGLAGIKICLYSHKPIDTVIIMLGTNDLKEKFHLTADKITAGLEKVVQTIQRFTAEKQNFIPRIIIVSPPIIGNKLSNSPFASDFGEKSIEKSKQLAEKYKQLAEKYNCLFYDAGAAMISDRDSIHLSQQGHKNLAMGLAGIITRNSNSNVQIRKDSTTEKKGFKLFGEKKHKDSPVQEDSITFINGVAYKVEYQGLGEYKYTKIDS